MRIVKDVVWAGEPTDAEFEYSPNDGLADNSDPAAEDFTLGDGDTETIIRVQPNDGSEDPDYTVTETDREGFRIGDVSCDDEDSSGDVETGEADIKVGAGETVTCTFVNEEIDGAILVVKEGPATVLHGDQVTYTFTVTNAGNSPLSNVEVTDDRCEPVVAAGRQNDDGDDLLENVGTPDATSSEVWSYTCTMPVPAHAGDEENPIVNTVTATGDDEEGNPVSDTDTHTTLILHPAILVEKDGPATVYHGDQATFTFVVSNPGDVGLTGITVADDTCAPVTGPTGKTGGNQDNTLDPGGAEKWTYTCTMTVPAHQAGEVNPIVNEVTATGTVPGHGTVTDTDTHSTQVLHPAIDIEKDGPATATQGDTLTYTLVVTNPGDVVFASDKVVVTDPQCDDQPTLVSVNGDPSPQSLNPGDTWTYTCSHVTTTAESSVTNVATVTGTDPNGRTVTDTDQIVTNLAAQLPDNPVNGTARLRGPSGCVKQSFKATVRGTRIAQVTFFIDGKRYKRLTAPTAGKPLAGHHQPARALVRRPPRHGPRAVRGGVRDVLADAAAELPAVQAADGAAALHRLSPALRTVEQ